MEDVQHQFLKWKKKMGSKMCCQKNALGHDNFFSKGQKYVLKLGKRGAHFFPKAKICAKYALICAISQTLKICANMRYFSKIENMR